MTWHESVETVDPIYFPYAKENVKKVGYGLMVYVFKIKINCLT